MIEIKNYPNNRDEFVGAEQLMKFLHGRTSGVFSLADSAAVSAKQNQMAVQVSDGYGWLANGEGNGCAWWVEAQKETGSPAELGIDPADGTLSRIDRVVISWETTQYTEHPYLKILKGENSSNPQPPALTNNSTTRQISLAQIRINAGALKVTPADITDERLNPAVCGLVRYNESADTSMINSQFTDLLALLRKQIEQTASGIAPDKSITFDKLAQSTIDTFFPVGYVWVSKNPTSPAALLGGTWEKQENIFILGASSKYPAGSTGGEAEHLLTVHELPPHKHPFVRMPMYWGETQQTGDGTYGPNTAKNYPEIKGETQAAGGNKPHNNMPPYKAYYIWERVA